ncbi:Adenylate kinase isoenzyme 5, partial [Nowakowskiella sp. JEL0078]
MILEAEQTHQSEAKNYFEKKQINQILESIVTGLTYVRPDDPITFIEDCCQRIRKGDLLAGKSHLRWDLFIPPPETFKRILSKKPSMKPANIINRDNKKLPQIYPQLDPTRKGPFIETSALPEVKGISTGIRKSLIPTSSTLPPIATKSEVINVPHQSKSPDVEPLVFLEPKSEYPSWNNVVFVIGAPLSGKSTLCERLAEKIKFQIINVRKILNNEADKKLSLGIEIKTFQNI